MSSSYHFKLPMLGIAVPSTNLAVTTGSIVCLLVLVQWVLQWVLKQNRLPQWPVYNKASPFNPSKAKNNFRQSADELLLNGFSKSPKGYFLDTDVGRQMILSPQYADELRNDPRLSFKEFTSRDFSGDLPGFEVFSSKSDANAIGVDVVRKKLTRTLGLVTEDISEEMAAVLPEQWSEETEWHEVPLKSTLLEMVARLSSRVFLGLDVCRNPEWIRITIDYTVNVFMASSAIKRYPKFLHRIANWYLPETRKIRAQVTEARRIIQPVIDRRAAAGWVHPGGQGYTDAIQWMHEMSEGRNYDPAIQQLGLSMAAIHTTTDLVNQILFDICPQPNLIQALRDEAIEMLKNGGWKRTGLYKLRLMDSVMKESQRLKPTGLVSMRRYVTEDMTLQDGVFLPKGSMLGVSSHWSWGSSSFYENPEKFDGYRFLRMSEDPETEKTAHFVSTSPQHLGFGYGKHACPGRFFAAN
ncbi:cytochrome P450, partial [Talaromyces proteolyticus]